MRLGRRQRGFTRSALALLAALSVLVSFALGGQRYFYCAEMNEVNLHACCEHAAEGSDHDRPVLVEGSAAPLELPVVGRNACCTMERFAVPAAGVRPARGEAPRAHAPALVGVECSSSGRAWTALGAVDRSPRGRPLAPDPREHRLRLMVFLT